MQDVHPKQSINDWLLDLNAVNQYECAGVSRCSPTTIATTHKRRLSETDFDQTDCENNRTRNFLLSMSEDGSTSNTSQVSRSLTNRPILVPTPPSSKRSTGRRSPSPTRKLLALLSKANPPIRISQPGNAVLQPQRVADLRKFLTKDGGLRVIPRVLEVR